MSTTRHGVTGTNTDPDGDDATKYPCTSTITCVGDVNAPTVRSAEPTTDDNRTAPVFVVP